MSPAAACATLAVVPTTASQNNSFATKGHKLVAIILMLPPSEHCLLQLKFAIKSERVGDIYVMVKKILILARSLP